LRSIPSFPAALAAALVAVTASCGGSDRPNGPVILAQPASQTVQPGEWATFTVTVDPVQGPYTFEWSWNGVTRFPPAMNVALDGPSFVTRPAQSSDDGSTFQVKVTNAVGTFTSGPATLTVSPVPRAPPVADLRFRGLDAAPFRFPVVSMGDLSLSTWFDATGTPLDLFLDAPLCDRSFCGSRYILFALPPGSPRLNVHYGYGDLERLSADVAALPESTVVTGIDAEDVATMYRISWLEAVDGGGFSPRQLSVDPGELATTVGQEGASGRVVTALSAHRGRVEIVSYAWTGDAATVYETATAGATFSTLVDVAGGLAAAGYVITAIGPDGAGGVLLVGVRVAGDTSPRPFKALTDPEAFAGADLAEQGFTVVGRVHVLNLPASSAVIWLGEQ
jgi:hypothetical protein